VYFGANDWLIRSGLQIEECSRSRIEGRAELMNRVSRFDSLQVSRLLANI